MTTNEPTVAELVSEAIRSGAGAHLCVIQPADASGQWETILPYVQDGLAEGDRCIYVGDGPDLERLVRALSNHGIDVETERERTALLLWTGEEWRRSVVRDTPALRALVDDALSAGFSGVRFAIEMTWTVDAGVPLDDLRRWEATIDDVCAADTPVRVLCRYSRARLSPAVIEVGLRAHPCAITGSDVCLNPYYDTPFMLDELAATSPAGDAGDAGGSTSTERRVDWMIAQLRRVRAIERARERRARQELERLLRRQEQQAAIITTASRINEIVASERDPDRAIQAVTEAAIDASGARYGAFLRRYADGDDGHGRYEVAAVFSVDGEPFDALLPVASSDLIRAAFAGGGSLRLDDLQRDARYQPGEPAGAHKHPPVRSCLAVPVAGRSGRRLGGMLLGHPEPARFTELAQLIVEGIATQVGSVLEHALLYESAQQAIEVREEFLGIASHELKTPMTVVKGYAMMLARRLRRGNIDPDDLILVVDELVEASNRLEKLVNDLLDTSRIQTDRLDLSPEPVDLSTLVATVFRRFDGDPLLTPGHRLLVDVPQPVQGAWDRGRLDQVLTNLVSNALKYSPGGGEVRVSIALAPDGQYAEIRVSDQGMGIPEAAQAELFQAFRRGQANDRAIPGSGLGLYVSSQIVERHGGTISVESAPGQGSTFIVRLPMASPDITSSDTLP